MKCAVMKGVQALGQKPQAMPGNIRATRIDENRFTALLSKIGFPDMSLAPFIG